MGLPPHRIADVLGNERDLLLCIAIELSVFTPCESVEVFRGTPQHISANCVF